MLSAGKAGLWGLLPSDRLFLYVSMRVAVVNEFHDDLKKVVISYLRRTGQGVFYVNGSYVLGRGNVNIPTLESAYRDCVFR